LSIEELEREFLAAPNATALVDFYEQLKEQLQDHLLAGVLEKIRPIQHRITWVQADAPPELLTALARDPHEHVRRVVAAHANINDEVCFRLAEDSSDSVRLALRKNDECHPIIRAALMCREDNDLTRTEILTETAWEAQRAGFTPKAAAELVEDWTGIKERMLFSLDVDQCNLMLEVFTAKAGKGKLPRKPRKRKN
jgi:hypothetical protein